MDVIERIEKSNISKSAKIIKLWYVAMLRYPKNDAAWKAMVTLTDQPTVTAIAYLTGCSTGMELISVDRERLEKQLNEKGDW